jgi:hypothetical protein
VPRLLNGREQRDFAAAKHGEGDQRQPSVKLS